jgi:hypothetical protein
VTRTTSSLFGSLVAVCLLLNLGITSPVMCAAAPPLASALSTSQADPGLRSRQRAALQKLFGRLVPQRGYPAGENLNCGRLNRDAYGLVAALELDRRGEGGIAPGAAAPLAQHVARALLAMQGTRARPGVCAPGRFGGPATMNAAAALAYALHRYGEKWPEPVKKAVAVPIESGSWRTPRFLGNLGIAVPVAALLAGEALGKRELFQRGAVQLSGLFDRVRRHGGKELNAPLYTGHHIPNLIFLLDLRDTRVRAQARILLEYELLVSAHLYLPGGGLGVPQSRDYQGGIADGDGRGLLPVLWLLTGDPELEIDVRNAYDMVVAAATDYVLPSVIRSIFLDKRPGYTFRARTDAPQGRGRAPRAVYALGQGGAQVAPWQAAMLPSGRAILGIAYGAQFAVLAVTSGVEIRAPDGTFAHLYQYQPMVPGDSDETGSAFVGSGLDDDPDDFAGELYDFERLMLHRTAITLWDPRPRPGVRRTHPDTRVHVPDLSAVGGESMRKGDWWIGRSGPAYFAYRPLGRVAEARVRDGGAWTYLRIPGRGGGIMEIATQDEFPTIESYAEDLAGRHVKFSVDPLVAEFDARDESGRRVRVRLEYDPEGRYRGGEPWPDSDALGDALVESPWLHWDSTREVLTVTRGNGPGLRYDWRSPSVREIPAASPTPE